MGALIHQRRDKNGDRSDRYNGHKDAAHGQEVKKCAPEAFFLLCCFFVHDGFDVLTSNL
jgi:hypothetical protein